MDIYLDSTYIHDHNNNVLVNSLFIHTNLQPIKELQYTYQMFGIIRTKHFHITCMYSRCFLYTIIYGYIERIQCDNLIKALMTNEFS